jgi:hypothetical protein
MAQRTILSCVEVSRILPRRSCAVVTRRTRAQNLVVVNRDDRRPDCRSVAVFADIGCQHMLWPFASRIGAVVTAATIINNIGVVEIRRQPGNRGVAVVAVVAAGKVRGVFANCGCAIVTGATGADDLSVVYRIGWYPGIRSVAVLANIGGLKVVEVFACRISTVVTAGTIAGDINVIKVRGQPTCA